MSTIAEELSKHLLHSKEHVLGLIEATPAERFAWRPSKEVKSVSEAFLHIGVGNYVSLQALGEAPPEGLDPTGEDADRFTREKPEIRNFVRTSFERLEAQLDGASDETLLRRVTFFGKDASVRDVLLTTLLHQARHLGQAITYARSNGVVPPWS